MKPYSCQFYFNNTPKLMSGIVNLDRMVFAVPEGNRTRMFMDDGSVLLITESFKDVEFMIGASQ